MVSNYPAMDLALYFVVIALLIIILIRISESNKKRNGIVGGRKTSGGGDTCTKDTCGAIDPVNEPAYNMQNIVKQSILLEEHIAEKNKYCLSCIVKHFLHVIALAEEAIWLAGPNVNQYPFLEESQHFYEGLFNTWLAGKHDENTKKDVLAHLRERRRQLIDVYFLA